MLPLSKVWLVIMERQPDTRVAVQYSYSGAVGCNLLREQRRVGPGPDQRSHRFSNTIPKNIQSRAVLSFKVRATTRMQPRVCNYHHGLVTATTFC